MEERNYTFKEVTDIVAENYEYCLDKARKWFTEEAVIQSAGVSVFINVSKEMSTVANLTYNLKQKMAKLSDNEAIPHAIDVWKFHFKDLVAELGSRLTGYIGYRVSLNDTPEELEWHVREYAYHLRCEKLTTIEEKDALYEQMFGKE